MTIIWTVLTTLMLLAAAGSFVAIVYPFRLLSSEARTSAGLVLVVSTFLMMFALHSALNGPLARHWEPGG